jgi:hypothetical protein
MPGRTIHTNRSDLFGSVASSSLQKPIAEPRESGALAQYVHGKFQFIGV